MKPTCLEVNRRTYAIALTSMLRNEAAAAARRNVTFHSRAQWGLFINSSSTAASIRRLPKFAVHIICMHARVPNACVLDIRDIYVHIMCIYALYTVYTCTL